VHASAENITPLRRALFSVVFNPVSNRPQHPRKEPYGPASLAAIRPLADDCLLTMTN